MRCSTSHEPCVSRWVGLCLTGAVAVSLVGCGAESVSGSEPAEEPVSSRLPARAVVAEKRAPDKVAAFYELPEGAVRVTGVVFVADEDMQPRKPFQSGAVVAIKRGFYDQFRLAARGPWKARIIDGRNFPLPGRLFADRDVLRYNLDAGGTYAFTLTPGDYVMCLGNLSEVEADAPSPDVWVERVFDVVITGEDLQTIVPVLDRVSGELAILR